MVSSPPFSSVLNQLIENAAPASSSKGKGKASAQRKPLLTTSITPKQHNWEESVEAFHDSVEKYKENNISITGTRNVLL